MDVYMDLKIKIIEELRTKDLENGIYDTSLESIKGLDVKTRRKLIFDLEKSKAIKINHTKQINDDNFPLIIVDCIK